MGEPFYEGMPLKDTQYETAFGLIRCGGACRDDSDYDRIVSFQNRGGQILTLQKAARDSYLAAEEKLGFAITVTGSNRTCEQQSSYYASDSARFAHPDKTAHTRGLAIDVSTALPWLKRKRIKRQLAEKGWFQSRPTDEPWHWSFGIQV